MMNSIEIQNPEMKENETPINIINEISQDFDFSEEEKEAFIELTWAQVERDTEPNTEQVLDFFPAAKRKAREINEDIPSALKQFDERGGILKIIHLMFGN